MQREGIVPSGLKDYVVYVSKNNLTIGVVGFSTYWWTSNMNEEETVKKLVSEAKSNANIVVVVFHGGGEGEMYSRTPTQTEWYAEEDRGDVRRFSHQAIDFGADIVLGSGPHVLRGIEIYNGKIIAYSLGNFASADSKLSTFGSLKTSAMLEVTLYKNGSFASASVTPFELDNLGMPHLDKNYTAISVINDLSRIDFGKHGIKINSDGTVDIVQNKFFLIYNK